MKHQYADVLVAIANGEQIQWQVSNSAWIDQDPETVLEDIAGGIHAIDRYRIKPKTVVVNGVECPTAGTDKQYRVSIFAGSTSEVMHNLNLWYSTKEDADTVFNALVKPFKEKK